MCYRESLYQDLRQGLLEKKYCSNRNTMKNDRIVLTLDAGGTNFVFTAVQSGQLIVDPVTLPSNAHDLDLCLQTMVRGFGETMKHIPRPPDAISFAFPGPADYELGIINKLPNLKAFDDDVAVLLERIRKLRRSNPKTVVNKAFR